MRWTNPSQVWPKFLAAAEKVAGGKARARKPVRYFAEAVLAAPHSVRPRLLLELGAAVDGYAYWALRTALIIEDSPRLLLPRPAFGVDVECQSGRTPLLVALACRDLRTADCLLDHGADPDFAGADGTTPLLAMASFQFDCRWDGPSENPMPLLRRLLTLTRRLDWVDGWGRTALSMAVEAGSADVARLLLAAGADPAAGGPLRRAIDRIECVAGHPDLVDALSAARGGAS
jgi:hypothetical protein